MQVFIVNALPWVLTGLALAILAVNCGMEKQKDADKGARIAMGAGLGLMFGVALNSCGLWESHALGLVLGALWGVALASVSGGKGEPQGKEDSDKD